MELYLVRATNRYNICFRNGSLSTWKKICLIHRSVPILKLLFHRNSASFLFTSWVVGYQSSAFYLAEKLMVVFPISTDIVSMLLYFPTEEEPKNRDFLYLQVEHLDCNRLSDSQTATMSVLSKEILLFVDIKSGIVVAAQDQAAKVTSS